MSPLELQQTLKVQIHPQPEPESSGTNRGTNTTSKSNTKPQKGIMGMFSNKPAVKNTSNEVKPEQKEDTAVVCPLLLLILVVFAILLSVLNL